MAKRRRRRRPLVGVRRKSGWAGLSSSAAGWRFQRCSVGRYWMLVTPVRESELGEEERAAARRIRDTRVP